jgi:hypothetical protein
MDNTLWGFHNNTSSLYSQALVVAVEYTLAAPAPPQEARADSTDEATDPQQWPDLPRKFQDDAMVLPMDPTALPMVLHANAHMNYLLQFRSLPIPYKKPAISFSWLHLLSDITILTAS